MTILTIQNESLRHLQDSGSQGRRGRKIADRKPREGSYDVLAVVSIWAVVIDGGGRAAVAAAASLL